MRLPIVMSDATQVTKDGYEGMRRIGGTQITKDGYEGMRRIWGTQVTKDGYGACVGLRVRSLRRTDMGHT